MSDQYNQEVLSFMRDFVQNRLLVSFSNLFCYNRDINVSRETKETDLFSKVVTKLKFVDKLQTPSVRISNFME